MSPPEDPDSDLFHPSTSNHHKRRRTKQSRTIFHRALEHLSLPLRSLQESETSVQFPQDCCKLESLRCHGVECSKYAEALLAHLRQIQFCDTQPWLGNLIDPITILFETLLQSQPIAAYEVALIGLGQTRKVSLILIVTKHFLRSVFEALLIIARSSYFLVFIYKKN